MPSQCSPWTRPTGCTVLSPLQWLAQPPVLSDTVLLRWQCSVTCTVSINSSSWACVCATLHTINTHDVSPCAGDSAHTANWLVLNHAALDLQCSLSSRPFNASQGLSAYRLHQTGLCMAQSEWSVGRSRSPSGCRFSFVPHQNIMNLVAEDSGWWFLLCRNLSLPVNM